MLKIGVIGLGFWGEHYIKYMLRMKDIKIVGFVDTDTAKIQNISALYNINYYDDIEQLIKESDALIMASSSLAYNSFTTEIIRQGKHCFVENPIGKSVENCNLLIQLIKEAKVKYQIGFIESFNPAYQQSKAYFKKISFVEMKGFFSIHRRDFNVDLILDILPHYIYILLDIIKNPIKNISANGFNVVSDRCDLLNVRIEFQNACVANIVINGMYNKENEGYQADFFQTNEHIKIDFLQQQSEISFFYNKMEQLPSDIQSHIKDKITLKSFSSNKIYDQLGSFLNSVMYDQPTLINEFSELKVMEIYNEIIKQIIQKNQNIVYGKEV